MEPSKSGCDLDLGSCMVDIRLRSLLVFCMYLPICLVEESYGLAIEQIAEIDRCFDGALLPVKITSRHVTLEVSQPK